MSPGRAPRATTADDQRGEQAVRLAHELKERIARERETVAVLKDHLLGGGAAPLVEDERLRAPRRAAPVLPDSGDWLALGECLRCQRSTSPGGGVRLVLAGEVDMAGALRLRALLSDLLEQGVGSVALDLAKVSFLDSNGLSALLWARRRALTTGAGFAITAVHPQLLRLLHVTRLDSILLPR